MKNLQYLKSGLLDWVIFTLILFVFVLGRDDAPLQLIELLMLLTVLARTFQWFRLRTIVQSLESQSTEQLTKFRSTHNAMSWTFGAVTFFAASIIVKLTMDLEFTALSGLLLFMALFLGRGLYAHVLHLHVVDTLLLARKVSNSASP